MYYVECPAIYAGNRNSLFVAGGISGCPDWQKEYVEMLRPLDIAVFNPRRSNWKGLDPSETERQIMWEHSHLAKANVISFWFCAETLNPITLYELGFWMNSDKPIVIGSHIQYQRVADVVIQTKLARPDIKVVYSIKSLAEEVDLVFQQLQNTDRP